MKNCYVACDRLHFAATRDHAVCASLIRLDLLRFGPSTSTVDLASVQRADLCYLFYLPFCQFFVSNDWVHKQSAPLFLRADQEFVAAEDLKSSLRALNDHYLALSESERNKSIHQMAPRPPKHGDNLVTRLWDRHLPKWRKPKTINATEDAPALKRRYSAPVPKGAMFACSADDDLAVFVLPFSELAKLIQKLWEKEQKRGGIGES